MHPKWIGQGIGRELLDWQTRRARDLYRDADVEVAWHMEAGAVVGHAPTERLLARYGLEVVRYAGYRHDM